MTVNGCKARDSIGALLDQARRRSERGSSLEAQLLLAQVLDRSRSWVLAHPEFELDPDQRAAYRVRWDRLRAGTPLPYLLGEWEFYGRSFLVGPAALIPRPETELLVELALELKPQACRVLDLGTGTGCLAVSLACELPRARVVATDLSLEALCLARANAARHGVGDRVRLVNADLTEPLVDRFDLICANLPYIPSERLAQLPLARAEPRLALDGGQSGLALIRRALSGLPRRLTPGGLALFEIDPEQAPAVQRLAADRFPAAAASAERDLAGRPRVVVVQNGSG